MLPLIIVAVTMLLAHEAGHVLSTRMMGGHWLGVQCKGFMIGVRLSITALTHRQVAWTLAAGSISESLVTAFASLIWPHESRWFFLILSLEWLLNLTPWGIISNDGTRLWRLWRNHTVS